MMDGDMRKENIGISRENRLQTIIIETSGLSVGYQKGNPVISGIDMRLERGSVAALIGANGSGKSTLLKTLTGELKPLAGTVMLDGRPMESFSRKELAKSSAILMTDRVSPGFLTVREVVALGRYPSTDITGRRSPHVLRHTLATELLDDGADLSAIKEMLGHSSLAATQVYTHNSVEKLKNVYNHAHPRAKNGEKHHGD